ncbi:MAG: hypothetical protein ABH854_02770 [Candidatus Diapherotrites archaeon]
MFTKSKAQVKRIVMVMEQETAIILMATLPKMARRMMAHQMETEHHRATEQKAEPLTRQQAGLQMELMMAQRPVKARIVTQVLEKPPGKQSRPEPK